MSLGDAVVHAIPDLRQAAESLMVDTATITRPGADTFNSATGQIESGAGTVVYTGPCRMRQPTGIAEAEILFGEQQVTRQRFVACFEHTVTGVQIDDIITITESADADTLAAGRQFRVTGVPMSTFTLYKGFPCEVVE